ncbi:ABC transporter ATP-binding protein [Massilimicrobiota timonensis]|uniref:ABC transporter ATP-binding protein/permease n=1 Tax=Massilimicrobiota timonensis TaxID=1776392 RepID=UPI0019603DD2|nr:ABC transporter ATP-binding protein [Massilimicrobiota timonensis]MBM6965316.1 ATP-binding cassette domain-containing protein [Massilimicrobiota timonensis]
MKLSHIHKVYHNKNNDIHALKDINLTIANQGLTYIIGPSGCGKTTLLNIISGKDKDFDGQVENSGLVECVEQNIHLIENMSVLDNLLLVINDQNKIMEMLEHFELNDFIHSKVKKLSVGQKKRIQIIRSLLVDCDYLICDEPTSALDYENSHLVMDLLQEISHKKSVIIVTHELALIDEYAGHVIRMGKGVIEEYQEIQDEPITMKKKISLHHIKEHFSLIIKIIQTRYATLLVKILFTFFIGCFIFVGISLFPSLDQMIQQNGKWQTRDNLIITQSRDHQMSSKTGDLYDDQDIQIVRDNVNGVIGYQFGWQAAQVSFNSVFYPEMYIDDIKEALSTMKPEDQNKDFYQTCLSILENDVKSYENESGQSFPKDIPLYLDYRNVETFQDGEDSSVLDSVNFSDYSFDVQYYQLFKDCQINLLAGRMMENNQEVVISQNLALELYKAKHLESMEQLIGMTEILQLNKGLSEEFQIVGIAYAQNQDDYMIFLQEGTMENLLSHHHITNKDKVKYLYISFISDVQEDETTIAQNINQVLNSQKSEFVVYTDSILVDDSSVENHQSLYLYCLIGGGFIVLIAIYILILFFDRKRYRKETAIYQHYGYQPLILYGVIIALSLLIVFILQTIFSTTLYHFFNTIAVQLGYPLLSSSPLVSYLLTFLITAIIIIFIEGMNAYATRTSKH